MKLLVIFVVLNIFNVILQTVKSIATVKCGKWGASLINAFAYGLYTVVVVYTVCDLPLWLKVVVVGVANLIGVYVVKLLEEKARKEKLWKIETTIPREEAEQMIEDCKYYGLTYNYVDSEKEYLFNFYCPTQKDSANVKNLLKSYNAKYFVSETKNL